MNTFRNMSSFIGDLPEDIREMYLERARYLINLDDVLEEILG